MATDKGEDRLPRTLPPAPATPEAGHEEDRMRLDASEILERDKQSGPVSTVVTRFEMNRAVTRMVDAINAAPPEPYTGSTISMSREVYQREVEDVRSKISEQRKQIEREQRTVEAQQYSIGEMGKQLADQQATIAALRENIEDQRAKIREQGEQIVKQAQSIQGYQRREEKSVEAICENARNCAGPSNCCHRQPHIKDSSCSVECPHSKESWCGPVWATTESRAIAITADLKRLAMSGNIQSAEGYQLATDLVTQLGRVQ